MSILGDICRPAVFFGCFGHHRQKDAALQDARTFAKTTKPAPPAGLQTSLNCKVEPLARSNSARGRTLQHQGEGSQSRASGCERVIGCRRQVRDLVFLVLVLQICRADGAGDERRAKIILQWTIGGSARVSRAGSGVAPESSLDKSVWETVFGATPKTATGTVALPISKFRTPCRVEATRRAVTQ
jgi:hypothetical protein